MENKPVLAILTESLRFDNQSALRYFSRLKPVHFYENAPYGDVKPEDLEGAVQYSDLRDLEKKLEELKPDIIQGAEPYASKKALKLCFVAEKIAKKLNIPLIFPMLENRPVKDRFGLIIGGYLKRYLKNYANQADLIFYLNNGARRNLLEVGVEESKLRRLLYGIWGVDTSIYRPMPEVVKENKILFVGRLDEAKGIPYLMKAWRQIAPDFPELILEFAGKGELEGEVTGFRVKKLGMIKNSDLPRLLNEALFVVYPSVTLRRWEEQVGMVNLQALSCGVPVVTTKSGAIAEYVTNEVGILVSERNAEELAQAMKKLVEDNDLRQKMGKTARQYILDKFDARKTIEKTEEILIKMLKDRDG